MKHRTPNNAINFDKGKYEASKYDILRRTEIRPSVTFAVWLAVEATLSLWKNVVPSKHSRSKHTPKR